MSIARMCFLWLRYACLFVVAIVVCIHAWQQMNWADALGVQVFAFISTTEMFIQTVANCYGMKEKWVSA